MEFERQGGSNPGTKNTRDQGHLAGTAPTAIALLVIGIGPAIAKDKHEVTERFQATAMDLDSGGRRSSRSAFSTGAPTTIARR